MKTQLTLIIIILLIIILFQKLEHLYLESKHKLELIDIAYFGGFAMNVGCIINTIKYLNLPPGAPIPLYQAGPVVFESSLLKYGKQNPSRISVGFSLGSASAVASATEELILVAPVLDTFKILRERSTNMEQIGQYLYFLLTFRNTNNKTIFECLNKNVKSVTYLSAKSDKTSPPEYILELAKNTPTQVVKIVQYEGTHNFMKWKNPQIIYNKY